MKVATFFPCSFLVALIGFQVGCAAPEEGTATKLDAKTYSVRGVVLQLPAGPAQELQIRHEAIPDFVGMDGKVAPMAPMIMPFPTPEGGLAGLAPGDKIRFELQVAWQAKQPLLLRHVTKLPADTILDFTKPPVEEEKPTEIGDADHGH
jgi:Copper binding periplasmic protein CusF